MDIGYKKRHRASEPKATLKIGLGSVLTLTILCLLLYCAPGSKYAVKTSSEEGLELAQVEQSLPSAASLLDVITDSNIVKSANMQGVKGEDKRTDKDIELETREAQIRSGGGLTSETVVFKTALQDGTGDKAASMREETDRLSSGECKGGICKDGKVKPSDFVFSIATHDLNEPTLIAGRAGRQGFRTYISTNYSETPTKKYPSIDTETWGFYPDDHNMRSFYEGDTRAALVPFLAFRDLGPTFEWLFYGDDDTILFLDSAMEMVKDLDPETPYFLTDHFWYSNWNYGYQWHPHWRAPRCLLCNSELDVNTLRMRMTKACPCTPQAICDLEDGYDNVLDKRKCAVPRSPTMTYSMHGGAGALISVGLLRKVSFEFMEDCVLNEWSTGGDAFITICLWKAGYAMTDPGPLWHEDGLTHFDPSPRKMMLDQVPVVIPRASYILGNFFAKAAGVCGQFCQNELKHVVSMHLRSRLLTNSSEGAGVFIRGVTRYINQLKGEHGSGDEKADLSLQLHDVQDEKSRVFAEQIDAEFTKAAQTLTSLAPNFKAIAAAKTRWPIDGGASVFVPKAKLQEEVNGTVVLNEEEIMKGGATGVARDLLEHVLTQTLQLYPPVSRRRLLP